MHNLHSRYSLSSKIPCPTTNDYSEFVLNLHILSKEWFTNIVVKIVLWTFPVLAGMLFF